MTGGRTAIRVELTLRCGRDPVMAQQMIPNGCRGQSRPRPAELLAAAGCAAGEFVVADTRAEPHWLEVADVIVCPGEPVRHRGSRSGWLDEILARYPGCAVAVTSLPVGGCLVAVRAGGPVRFAACGETVGAGVWAVVCGSVVHGWLAAGWPVPALEPGRVRLTACTLTARPWEWRIWGQLPGGSFWCRMLGAAGAPGTPVSSRCRSSSVSGAPSSA